MIVDNVCTNCGEPQYKVQELEEGKVYLVKAINTGEPMYARVKELKYVTSVEDFLKFEEKDQYDCTRISYQWIHKNEFFKFNEIVATLN